MVSTESLQHPQRIAVLRALQLGDLLVAVPALRALRARFPDAEITLIGLPWAESFVQRYRGYIDRFVAFPGYPGMPEIPVDAAYLEMFVAQQCAYGYDLAIQMHGSGRTSNAFVRLLGAKMTIGYYEPGGEAITKEGDVLDCSGGRGGLTLGLPYPVSGHEIRRNLDLLALLDCQETSTRLEFPVWAQDRVEIAALLPELDHVDAGPWIAVHPGSRSPARRWPYAYFAHLADELAMAHHARIVFTGSADEMETIEQVMGQMHSPAQNLAGRTSLGALAALMERLHLFISNDTGPAHLACAVDCPSITLFGPAEWMRWTPLDRTRHIALRHDVACSPCGYWQCPIDHRCLRRLLPAVVEKVAEGMLKGC